MESDARSLDVDQILDSALRGQRISELNALALLQSPRLIDIGQVAHLLRSRIADPEVVIFIVDRNINYTNYCHTDCGFCAFYRKPGSETGDGYLHSKEKILQKVQETIASNGTAALLQGGHNPDLDIEWYEELFSFIKQHEPTFHLHALSPGNSAHIHNQNFR